MLLADVVEVSRLVAATPSRSAKVAHIAGLLANPGLRADEIEIAVAYLSGDLRQRRTGVGWATLRDLPSRPRNPT
jgi:DNA ligase-1